MCDSVTLMPKARHITIKELHDKTGALVRMAGASKDPIPVTDRGEVVAVLASPTMLQPRPRKRIIVPGYEELMSGPPGDFIQAALDEIREDR